MAYFVKAENRIRIHIFKALDKYFGDHAQISEHDNGVFTIEILSGFDKVVDKLTPEELEQGVFGGGYQEALNGLTFKLRLGD